jgi:hypothetical protein
MSLITLFTSTLVAGPLIHQVGAHRPRVNRASPAVDQALETGVVVDQVNQGRAAQVQGVAIGVETDGILT